MHVRLRTKRVIVCGILLLLIGAGVVRTLTTTVKADLAAGLAAYWKFDDGSGTIAMDSSGNGNTGILHGATWTNSGRVNGALHFNGINSWVEVPDSDSVDLSKNFTVACWIYPDVHAGNYNMLVSKHQPYINSDHSWYWGIKNDVSTFVNWGNPEIRGTQDIPLNSWTHVAITYIDATMSFCFYNNGQLDRQMDADLSIRNTDKMLVIGSENGSTNFYDGLIDDVRIYNRALTSNEVLELYQANENASPSAGFTVTPVAPVINQQITFNASMSNDPDGSITKYEWDWNNDGTYEEYHSTPTATHSWDQGGSFPVTLQVTDNSGATSIKTVTVSVSGSNGGGTSTPTGIPGFEAVVAIGAIAVAFLLWRQKR